MTQDNLKQIQKIIIENLTFFDAPINELKVKMFAQELASFPAGEVGAAFSVLRKEAGRNKMPMPADVVKILFPQTDPNAEAQEAAARILQATSKFGYIDPEGAKNFIGSLGWRVVERFGGWKYICENLGVNLNASTFFAQARDVAKASIGREALGLANSPPSLDSQETNQFLQIAKGMVKKIEK